MVLACTTSEDESSVADLRAQSLVDLWPSVEVRDAVAVPDAGHAGDFRFADLAAEGPGVSWRALDGVESLRIEGGLLRGSSSSAEPTILIEVAEPLGIGDRLWAVELRQWATAGSRASVHPVREPGPPMPVVLGRIDAWPVSSPMVASPGAAGAEEASSELTTYRVDLADVFLLEMPTGQSNIRQILLRPTNEAGAEFGIESLRLIFRREHLASIPSGVGWHGLGEIYREALVSRVGETLRFEVQLPEEPWLDLAVGALEEPAPAFTLAIGPVDGALRPLRELQPRSAESWLQHRVDLSTWAGQRVALELRADDGDPGALAFWGNPAIRGAMPPEEVETVVLFLCDTLRRDHLEAWAYDRETAPNLARLAAEGTRFADAVAQATWTKASVSSILTSLHPGTTGVSDLHDRIAAGETTLAEVFRQAGYATFATSSVPFTGQLTNLHQGVGIMHELGALGQMQEGFQSKSAKAWVDLYLDWLDQHQGVPTFALVHVMDPHSPFRPRAPYDTLWSDEAAEERFLAQAEKVRPLIKSPLLQRFLAPSAEELAEAGVDAESFVRHEKDWYDGSIRGMDTELGRLVAHLESSGLAESTLLAFVSDHGEEFLEHGQHWHGQSVYGEVAGVPMVLWGQGIPAGKVVEETVQTVDLMPTLLDHLGLPTPERAQGRSLLPLLGDGPSGRPMPAFTTHIDCGAEGEWDCFAMISDGWKLIWNKSAPDSMPEHELYDHGNDPLDQSNLAEEHPEIVERMAPQLRRWLESTIAARLDPDAIETQVSAEELERLRSLGYVN